MGISQNGYLVYGVRCKFDYYYPRVVTKYNEDTGKPYEKTVETPAYILPPNDIVWWREDVPDELVDACDVGEFGIIGGYHRSDQVLGRIVASIEYGETVAKFQPLSDTEQEEVKSRIEQILGDGVRTHVEVGYYMVCYMSG